MEIRAIHGASSNSQRKEAHSDTPRDTFYVISALPL
jgi:hypothetical protein